MPDSILMEKREIRVKNETAIGFLRLLQANNIEPLETFKNLALMDSKQEVADLIDTLQDFKTTDPFILSVLANRHSAVFLDEILRNAKSIALEAQPISEEKLLISNKDFLKNLDIECSEMTLQDYFNNIVVVSRDEDKMLHDEMDDEFQWSNNIGQKAWDCLINKNCYDAKIVFFIDAIEDRVVIDLKAKGYDYPVIIDGYESSRNKVKKFVSMIREKQKETKDE